MDSGHLLPEVHTRWLKPAEVLFILQNHETLKIFHEPLQKPPSGTLILFNRSVLRYFRKDGHNWRIKEGHEHLTVGNVKALNCYYSTHEENPKFKRRCYWILNSKEHEHIVLIHYRELTQVRQNNIINAMQSSPDPATPSPSPSTNSTQQRFYPMANQQNMNLSIPGSGEVNSSANDENQLNIQENTQDLDDSRSIDPSDLLQDHILGLEQGSIPYNGEFLDDNETPGDFNSTAFDKSSNYGMQMNANDFSSLPPQTGEIEEEFYPLDLDYESDRWKMELHSFESPQNVTLQTKYTPKQDDDVSIDTDLGIEDENWWEDTYVDVPLRMELPSSTSIFRFRDDDIDEEWNMPNHSCFLEITSSGETISQEQICTIQEISPEWGYASEPTKVIIIGSFFSGFLTPPSESVWTCMFGDIEVPAQLIQQGVIKCIAPPRLPGKVTLCIISGNQESTSEVEEFEYRAKPINLPKTDSSRTREEQFLHTKFAQMLLSDKPQAEIEEEIHPHDLHYQDDKWKVMLHGFESPQNVILQTNLTPKVENDGIIDTAPRTEDADQVSDYDGCDAPFQTSTSNLQDLMDGFKYPEKVQYKDTIQISQEQKFTIQEISPEWGYASDTTKVIIIGSFLCDPWESVSTCIFGEIEVPAEIIQDGVIKCMAPPSLPGKFKLCITLGNQESAREVGEFEYRVNPNNLPETDSRRTPKEKLLHTKLLQMLLSDIDSLSNSREDEESWNQGIKAVEDEISTSSITTNWLLMELCKDKLTQWLNFRSKEDTNQQGSCSLSKKEQEIIHIISGLGFEWALHPILKSGVSVNFRDANGWAPLHWAARFGREKIIAALMASGASAIAVTDPTADDPTGRTPADIASAYGHSELAEYLSELALTTHLSSLTLEEPELSKGSGLVEAETTLS